MAGDGHPAYGLVALGTLPASVTAAEREVPAVKLLVYRDNRASFHNLALLVVAKKIPVAQDALWSG